MVGNHQFQEKFGHQRAKIGPMLAKIKSVLNTHPISLYAKFEEKYLITFANNGRKPPIPGKFWPPEGQNWPDVGQNRISSGDSPNKSVHQV